MTQDDVKLLTYQLVQVGVVIHGLLAGKKLEKDDSEAVDIRFLVQT